MKALKWVLASSIALAMTSIALNVQAAPTGNSPGYYYIAHSYISPGNYQYMKVGAFSTQEECAQARMADYGNGDAWIPFDGTGIACTYVYANDVGSMNDVISHWNTLDGGNNGTTVGYVDEEALRIVSKLREIYQVEKYEADLARITDPNRDLDQK